jgi:hypothetical protein
MLGGCAAHRVPLPTVSADWSTVRALAQAWAENPPQNEFKWKFVVAGTAAGATVRSLRAAPTETFQERLVYMRA